MTALDKLLQIPGWGKQTFAGAHYQVKFRIQIAKAHALALIYPRYPELIKHTAKTGYILIGGTFHTSSQFLFDLKRALKIKKNA